MPNPSVIRARQRKAVTTPAQSLPWTFVLLVIVCASVVATGFFLAARQHFTSIDYGIKNSRLRDQLQNLEAEKRRLLLAREVALSPVAMRKAARGLGLRESGDAVEFLTTATAKSSTAGISSTDRAMKAVAAPKSAPAVVKTALAAPARVSDGGETRTRVTESSKAKKDRDEVATLLKLR